MFTLLDQVADAIEHVGCPEVIAYLTTRRWFGSKGRQVTRVRVLDAAGLTGTPAPAFLMIIGVQFTDGPGEHYFLPLVIRPASAVAATPGSSPPIVLVQTPEGPVAAWESTTDPSACFAFLDGIRQAGRWQGRAGRFLAVRTPAIDSLDSLPRRKVAPVGGEQSNTSLVYDSQAILKLVRKLEPGINPDGEMLEFLTTRTSYRYVPAFLGQIRYESDGAGEASPFSATVAVLQSFVPNEGDGWTVTLRHLDGLIAAGRSWTDALTPPDAARQVDGVSGDFFARMQRLGEITAGLHAALASDPSSPAFRPEPITATDVEGWRGGMIAEIHEAMARLRGMPETVLDRLALDSRTIEALQATCLENTRHAALLAEQDVMKIRIHGDYHLGQVLSTSPDFRILDFEGEPARTLAERRAKACALKDVAGMLRSFNYARHVALRQSASPSEPARMALEAWEQRSREMFLRGYYAVVKPGEAPFLPPSPEAAERLLTLFEAEKAVYELRYEINNRPDWIDIPIQGLQRLLGR